MFFLPVAVRQGDWDWSSFPGVPHSGVYLGRRDIMQATGPTDTAPPHETGTAAQMSRLCAGIGAEALTCPKSCFKTWKDIPTIMEFCIFIPSEVVVSLLPLLGRRQAPYLLLLLLAFRPAEVMDRLRQC